MSEKDQKSGAQDQGGAGSPQDSKKDQKTTPTIEELQAKIDALTKANADQFKELKGFKSKASLLEAEKQKAEDEKLKEQGKFKDLLEKRENDLTVLTGKFKNKVMDEQVKNAALKAGCKDIGAFMKLAGDYSDKVKFSDDFDADPETLTSFINETKESYSSLGLFGTDNKPPQDGGHGGSQKTEKSFVDSALEALNLTE